MMKEMTGGVLAGGMSNNAPRNMEDELAKMNKKLKGVAEGSSKTKNEYGIDFKAIKAGNKVVLEDGETLTVISKTRFRNGMLALKVKDESHDDGWSLANFLEVKKVRK